jgi:prepilin-type N-terminal cleavage/methylation domain-containing protein/prepilin-type processing-associated H-X9-DG protein
MMKHNEQNKRAFTLIELLVVIAIISILASILFPVFARARENARRASCLSNVKQILLGIAQYTQDYDEKYMPMYTKNPTYYWPHMIEPYLKSTQVYNCPSSSDAPYSDIANYYPHYGLNSWLIDYNGGATGRALASIGQPSATVLMTDSMAHPRVCPEGFSVAAYNVNATWPQYRHLETTSVGFFDGHVKAMRKSALEVKATTEEGQTLTGDDQFLLWNLY